MTTNEEDKQTTKPENQPHLTMLKAPDFKSIYANWASPMYSPFDISLTVGEAVAVGPKDFEITQSVRVTFAPAEAKIVIAMLINAMRQHEKMFGEVKIPAVAIPAELADGINKTAEEFKEDLARQQAKTEGE